MLPKDFLVKQLRTSVKKKGLLMPANLSAIQILAQVTKEMIYAVAWLILGHKLVGGKWRRTARKRPPLRDLRRSDSCGEFLMRFQNADCSVFCPFNLYDYGLSQPTKHGPNGTVNSSQWPGSKACGQHGLKMRIGRIGSAQSAVDGVCQAPSFLAIRKLTTLVCIT